MTNKLNSRPIGIFDSGVGGLTVARQIFEALPNEEIVYLGDSLRAPYGDRPPDVLAAFSREIIDFLLKHSIKALVVACGTISAKIFDQVQQMCDLPVQGMVPPGVKAALAATKTGRIGVVATAGTVASQAHKAAIHALRPDASVVAVACPLFVPLAEEGWLDNPVAEMTAQIYMSAFKNSGIDTLLLGCTHYPLLISSIKKALPGDVAIIDPAATLAQNLKKTLESNGLLKTDQAAPSHRFYITAGKEKFDKISRLALGRKFEASVVKL